MATSFALTASESVGHSRTTSRETDEILSLSFLDDVKLQQQSSPHTPSSVRRHNPYQSGATLVPPPPCPSIVCSGSKSTDNVNGQGNTSTTELEEPPTAVTTPLSILTSPSLVCDMCRCQVPTASAATKEVEVQPATLTSSGDWARRFPPPPPLSLQNLDVMLRTGTDAATFYHATIRWYTHLNVVLVRDFPRVLELSPCPEPSQYVGRYEAWVRDVSLWWKARFGFHRARSGHRVTFSSKVN